MSKKILLLTCDSQNLDQIPEEWKDELDVDLIPKQDKQYDACFVYEKVDQPIGFKVREGQTYFIPGEPPTIKGFGTPFLKQFDTLVSFRNDLPGKSIKGLVPCLTPWRVGLDEALEREGAVRHIRTPEEMKSKPIQKTKFMSMIVSNKPGTPLQRARLKLAKTLHEKYPGLVDIYGRGINDIKDKADALDPYLFSIAIENSYIPNYMTEKLTDCFVTMTVPLYSGCPNAANYYNGFIEIDPWDINSTIKLILELREDAENVYKSYLNILKHSLNDLVYKHSIIAWIKHLTEKSSSGEFIEKTLTSDEVGYYW